MEYPVLISKKLLSKQNLMETLKFAYAIDPQAFIVAFNNAGVGIDSKNIDRELVSLFKLSQSKGDINGDLKRPNGSQLKFSVIDVLYNMDINHKVLERAENSTNPDFIIIKKAA